MRDEPRRASPFAPAPVGWPAGDVVAGRGAVAWATLGPAAAAALLCLLLTAMLLLGSCA